MSALDLAKYTIQKRLPKIKTIQIDGSVIGPKRAKLLTQFQKKAKYQVLLLNTTVGGLGLNLTQANWGLLLDNWWNDMIPDQAIARMHRFGQTEPVTVVELFRVDTIDKRIFEVREKKREDISIFVGDMPTKRGARSKLGQGAGIDLYTMTRILNWGFL